MPEGKKNILLIDIGAYAFQSELMKRIIPSSIAEMEKLLKETLTPRVFTRLFPDKDITDQKNKTYKDVVSETLLQISKHITGRQSLEETIRTIDTKLFYKKLKMHFTRETAITIVKLLQDFTPEQMASFVRDLVRLDQVNRKNTEILWSYRGCELLAIVFLETFQQAREELALPNIPGVGLVSQNGVLELDSHSELRVTPFESGIIPKQSQPKNSGPDRYSKTCGQLTEEAIIRICERKSLLGLTDWTPENIHIWCTTREIGSTETLKVAVELPTLPCTIEYVPIEESSLFMEWINSERRLSSSIFNRETVVLEKKQSDEEKGALEEEGDLFAESADSLPSALLFASRSDVQQTEEEEEADIFADSNEDQSREASRAPQEHKI